MGSTLTCRSSASPGTSGSSTRTGSDSWSRASLRRPMPARASSCCTSTSACPRSTSRATCRAPSISTRTGSRTRSPGTDDPRPRSRRPCCRLGIAPDTTVVVYGRDTVGDANEKWPGRRAGQIAATRAALILRYAGVTDVRLLDGGYDRWIEAGLPIDTVDHRPTPIADVRPDHPAATDLHRRTSTRRKPILADRDGAALVSVRTWNEHIGQVSGYNYIGPAGRIAGDVWGNCGTDAYHMQHYRNLDNTMRPYPEIAANWVGGRHHAGQAGRLLLRDRLARRRDVVLRRPHGLARTSPSTTAAGSNGAQDPTNNPIEVGDPTDAEAAA